MIPESESKMPRRPTLIAGAIGIVVIVLSIGFLGSRGAIPEKIVEAEGVESVTVEIPAFTPEVAERLAKSNGFQALASYTDRGFEPSLISIAKGQTIRFTNNSKDDLWIESLGKVYPKSPKGCGESGLNSCEAIIPMDFWEFTLEHAGVWELHNKLVPSHALKISVE